MWHVKYILLSVLLILIPMAVLAGNLDDPGAPTSAASAMYTLEDIYNRLSTNATATKRTGAFSEPVAAPGSTGFTLDQIYEKAIPTQVPKTGQTTSYGTGSDGNLQKGVSWPSPRFADNGDGTVTDNLTGLVWLKNANCFGQRTWVDSLTDCNALANGTCGLTDSSSAGSWRLPNVKELQSVLDFSYDSPALSNAAGTGQWSEGDAFSDLQSRPYWTSTTHTNHTTYALYITMENGLGSIYLKTTNQYVWPVRGGQ
jgi:hypothetical protein